MQLYEIILIGLVLSIDACAITIANCATYKGCLKKSQELSMPISFAVFQGIMPLIGFFIGYLFSAYIKTATKFITAAIFFLLALKIIIDIIKENKEEVIEKDTCKIKKP